MTPIHIPQTMDTLHMCIPMMADHLPSPYLGLEASKSTIVGLFHTILIYQPNTIATLTSSPYQHSVPSNIASNTFIRVWIEQRSSTIATKLRNSLMVIILVRQKASGEFFTSTCINTFPQSNAYRYLFSVSCKTSLIVILMKGSSSRTTYGSV